MVLQPACQAMIACRLVALLAVLLLAPTAIPAQDDAAIVEYMRRLGPELAERYIALRDAQAAAVAELGRATERYNAGGPALRSVSLPALRQAKRRYAETSLALLEFLDARDRQVIGRLEADIERLKRGLDDRARARAELEHMLRNE
ncbi:MAG: hypothetical protein DMD78_00930 [Candidatus Rokuibacteriota bacterium]|nr:MAG: hypothetical protein DMD78_00930 [Candidatus Rokubacteria bacterium]